MALHSTTVLQMYCPNHCAGTYILSACHFSVVHFGEVALSLVHKKAWYTKKKYQLILFLLEVLENLTQTNALLQTAT